MRPVLARPPQGRRTRRPVARRPRRSRLDGHRHLRHAVHDATRRSSRALRDAFGWDHVGAHDDAAGWLIFRLPPAELGVHPAGAPAQEISFLCDDVPATMAELAAKGVEFTGEPEDRVFGVLVTMVLPGEVKALLPGPRHRTAI